MRITFVLPGPPSSIPIGGYRVIYEYGNQLLRRDHEVNIWHLLPQAKTHGRVLTARRAWQILYRRFKLRNIDRLSWFKLEPGVRVINTNEPQKVPDADAIIATGWQTAWPVFKMPPCKGIKMHFVADYEQWVFASESEKRHFAQAFSLPLYKIAMSQACARMVRLYSDQLTVPTVPLGLDSSLYKLIRSPSERHEPLVGLAYRTPKYKGIEDALDALRLTKTRVSSLSAILFGSVELEHVLDPWMTYLFRPDHERVVELYNSIQVFLVSSWAEGWGLPGMEAMACGATLCSTDTGGVHEYADHNRTALISPPRESRALADNLVRLLNDSACRQKIASAGYERAKKFTWTRATERMEQVIRTAILEEQGR